MDALVRIFVTALLVCCFSSFYSCSSEDVSTIEELNTENSVFYVKIEDDVIHLINEYRISKNLAPLEKLNLISMEAKKHTEYMISENEVNHDYFSEREYDLRNSVAAIVVGENVGYGYHTAKGVVDAWIKSDSHRKNIEGDFNTTGISAMQNKKGDYFYTHIFVKR